MNYYYLGTCIAKLMRFVFVRMEQVRRRRRQVLHRTARSRRVASGQFGIVAGTGTGYWWRGRRKRVVEMSGRRSVFPRRRSRFCVRAVTQRGQVWRRVHQAAWFQRRKERKMIQLLNLTKTVEFCNCFIKRIVQLRSNYWFHGCW